ELYPQFNQMQTTIDTIDGVINDASIGFRKAAEQIRNNPDISVWQSNRRLQELKDMQDYAPIFNGLSLRDLISYRNQLSTNMNYYSKLFQQAISGIEGLTDLRTPAQRAADAAEYMGKGAEYSTDATKALQGIAGLLIPGYSYENEIREGKNYLVTYKVDPVTKQRTRVSERYMGTVAENRGITDEGIPTETVRPLDDSSLQILAQGLIDQMGKDEAIKFITSTRKMKVGGEPRDFSDDEVNKMVSFIKGTEQTPNRWGRIFGQR
ncbi:MAG: hypothetical protein ACTSQA_03230, partial [Candidatus Heimdallarchaeaceae archaeon]